MVQDFDDRECVDVGEFKGRLFELTKAYFDDEDISLDDVNVGFIGPSNQKTIVNTSNQVEDGYESRFLHKSNELVLFIERKKPEKRSARKRKSASTNDDSAEDRATLGEDTEKEPTRVENIQKRLSSTHGNRFSNAEYFLWAETIENGIHNSYEKPPDVPPFTERRPKKVKASATSTSCGETFVQMAEAFTSVLNRPSEPQPKPEGTQKACNVRSVILGQMKEIGELLKEGILSQAEFDEQKAILINELRNIKQ
ncbi:hypothetical protein ACROYT_G028496 [Oculina patagonica]